ncbi:hypothetical protein CQW23_21309 [Capsicum baccatum]|uniref:HTH myb-type domain-containing protein n=1 Tax=Capsicum baccatum TaxID=33114 RepID=A0A2G2VXM7_CAPBA|nr:hypothetical protein CQW23_21309 [Capsicum baccatum]
MQVASHAQKYFIHLKVIPKEKRRESTLDITSVDGKVVGTSHAVPSTKKKSMLPGEGINADQTIAADATETGFIVDAERSLLNREQLCAAANCRAYGHPITRIRSDIEELIIEPMDKNNDVNSIFDVWKALISHYPKLFNVARRGVSSYAAGVGAENTP